MHRLYCFEIRKSRITKELIGIRKIAKFEKVTFEQFKEDVEKNFSNSYIKYTDQELKYIYDNIELPTRATTGSAGYDFKCPFNVLIGKYDDTVIPTGIRVRIDNGWVLKLYPRSGLGFKYGLKLVNTVGIIDSDYYNSDNEGHIMIKIKYDMATNLLDLKQGEKFSQGVFVEYGITEDDEVNNTRNGGFGSTDKRTE